MQRHKIYLIAALILWLSPLQAQKKDANTPLAAIPFLFDGHQVLIPVTINQDKDTLHFLFDSGCEVNILSTRASTQLHLTVKGEAGISGWRKEMTMVPEAHAQSLEVGKISIPYPKFYLQKLEAKLQNVPVDGVLGYTLLQRYAIKLDFRQKKMYLYRSGNFHYPAGKGELLKLGMNYKTPTIEAALTTPKGETFTSAYHVITGGNFGLLLNAEYVKKYSLESELPPTGSETRQDLLLPVTYTRCVVPAFHIGKRQVDQVPALYSPKVNDTSPDREIAGSIGALVWQHFTLIINLPKQTLFLIPVQ